MSVGVRRGALVGLVVILIAGPLSCSRGQAHREAATRAPATSAYENPAAEPHPSPRQPTGAQTAGRDSLLNLYRSRLAEWAGLWAAAQPGFGLDSTWLVTRRRWSPLLTRKFEPPAKESPDDVTFEILGIRSPDARYTLNVAATSSSSWLGTHWRSAASPNRRSRLAPVAARAMSSGDEVLSGKSDKLARTHGGPGSVSLDLNAI